MKLWIGNPTFDVLPLPWEICSPFNNSWLRKTRQWKYIFYSIFFFSIFYCMQTEEGGGAGIWRKPILSLSKDLRDGVQEGDRDGGEEDVGDHVDDRGGHGEGRQDVRRVRWLRRVVLRPCCCPLGLLEYFIGQLDYHFSTYSIDKYFNVLHLESKSFH